MASRLKIMGAAPLSNDSVDIYRVLVKSLLLFAGQADIYCSGTLTGIGTVSGTLTNVPATSNTDSGRKISILFDSSNSGIAAVTINGIVGVSATSQTVNFLAPGITQLPQLWKSITSVVISSSGFDFAYSNGTVTVQEQDPMSISNGGGDPIDVASFNNGEFVLINRNTENELIMPNGWYFVDYKMPVQIPLKNKGSLTIGSDHKGENFWDGAVENPMFFGSKLSDVKAGSTTDFVNFTSLDSAIEKQDSNSDILMSLDLDQTVSLAQKEYERFDAKFPAASSVNLDFGDSISIESEGFKIKESSRYLGNKNGTIEFFFSPILDTYNQNEEPKYLMQASTSKTISLDSISAVNAILAEKAKKINAVYMTADSHRTPLRFRLEKDSKTIRLLSPLVKKKTNLTVSYLPVAFEQEELSIYLDGYGTLHYGLSSGDKNLEVVRSVNWKRNTWHRIMCTWSFLPTGKAALRLMVDGTDQGNSTWGDPDLIWDGGQIWGTNSGSGTTVGNLSPFSELNNLTFGAKHDGSCVFPMRLDNLRFSGIAREPIQIGSSNFDLVWNDNYQFMKPVIEDAYTKGIFDFDRALIETKNIANVLYGTSPQYSIGVEVDDGFSKVIETEASKNLLLKLYSRLKPAHLKLYSAYKQDKK